MNENVKEVLNQRIERAIKGLENHNMNGYYAKDIDNLFEIVESLLNKNDVVSFGGSMTLFETGLIEFIRNGEYRVLDRYEKGLSKTDMKELFRKTFSADAFFASANAIIETGEIYNVDGNGNRVAAMIYGPDKVIIIAGANKIVKNLDEAINRNKYISAPANTKRLNVDTPCKKTGVCVDCNSIKRICNKYSLIRKDNDKNRMHVIFLDESYGF